MEISITAVTRNREFTKSLVRHAQALAPLKDVARRIGTAKLAFDVIQIVFIDKSGDCVKVVGCRGGRIFQVEVPIPDAAVVDFHSAASFVSVIADRLSSAATLCGLPKDIEIQFIEAVRSYRSSERP